MIIDCDRCEVRGTACADCVIGVLLGVPEVPREPLVSDSDVPSSASTVQLDAPERRALGVLADQGLVPRLRLVAAPEHRSTPDGHAEGATRHVG